ncbi:Histone deacetylase complex subunit sap18 [Batrachochytrium dendrobatidis]|nr:Histone deacetylase complex subunit sap18 [Batrachochytrium dendrobatidis]KAK5669245.1 Histone deacetylase complex subunit sap18 [Batrachochytrium dendrobatidis]
MTASPVKEEIASKDQDLNTSMDTAADYSVDVDTPVEMETVESEAAPSNKEVSITLDTETSTNLQIVEDNNRLDESENSTSHSKVVKEEQSKHKLDRSMICPFLIRVFVNSERVHDDADFGKGKLPTNNSTIREVAALLGQAMASTADASAKLIFRTVNRTEHFRGIFKPRTLGSIFNFKHTLDEARTLDEVRFVPGDFIDVSVITSGSGFGGSTHTKLGGGMRSDKREVMKERSSFDGSFRGATMATNDHNTSRFDPYNSSRKEALNRLGPRGSDRDFDRGQRRPNARRDNR